MPDTSVVSPSSSDIAIWAGAVGTFLAALITGLGLKRGNDDRGKPSPTAETAGPLGLIVEENLLKDMHATLKEISGDVRGLREDLDEAREDEKDRRQAEKLNEAVERSHSLEAELEALRSGQRQTHSKQDEYGEKIDRLLKAMEKLRVQ